LFSKETIFKSIELITLFTFFYTPLLFFTQTHDQFELPKLLLLSFTGIFILSLQILSLPVTFPKNHLFSCLLLFFATQLLASLPFFTLSWTTSWLGDYENFSGVMTLLIYILWFWILSQTLTQNRINKVFFFLSLAAILSSFYAIAQHFGFDFIQWNPDSVITSREFAALGNPNFLAAFLAMALPFSLYFLVKNLNSGPVTTPSRDLFFPLGMGFIGFGFLCAATAKAQSLLGIPIENFVTNLLLALGFALFTMSAVRFLLIPSWWISLISFSILAVGLLTTGSRGGFLGALAGGCLFLIFASRDSDIRQKLRQELSKIPKIFQFSVLGLLVILGGWLGSSFFIRLFHSVLHAGDSLAVSRLHIWRPAFRIIASNPIHGVGLDTFKIAFPFYSGIEFNQIDGMFMSSRTAHDELLQITATTGLLGLAAYLALLVAFLLTWLQCYRHSTFHTRWLLVALLSCAAAYQVQNIFSFGVSTINLIWFFCLAAVQKISTLNQPTEDTRTLSSFNPWFLFPKFIAFLLVVVLFFFSIGRLGSDVAFSRGSAINDMMKKPNPNLDPSSLAYYSDYGITEMKKAAALCPLEVKFPLYLGLAYEQRAGIDPSRAKDWLLLALPEYEKAIQMSPANAYYYNDEGRVHTQLALYDPQYWALAEADYQKAVYYAPSSPFFMLNLSTTLQSEGKAEPAKEELAKAFQLDAGFTSKIMTQMAVQKYQTGQKDAAFEYLNEAIAANTTNADAFYYRGLFYLDEKKNKEALADLQRSKAINPNNSTIDNFIQQAKQ